MKRRSSLKSFQVRRCGGGENELKIDTSITISIMLDFMRRLHLEVLKLEFYQYNVDKKDETIR